MTPPATTASPRRQRPRGRAPRRAATRRRSGVRRRRLLVCLVGLGLLAGGVVLAMPLFKKAESEFGLPLAYQDIIREQAADEHLDPALIAGVIYAETKFDSRTSHAGAEGLMQIMPATAEVLARRSGATTFKIADLSKPSVNIAYGSYLLRYLLDAYGGDKVLALAAYNGGETNVDHWLAEAHAQGHGLTVDEIPFPETRAYVLRVLQAQRDYRHTYATQLGYR